MADQTLASLTAATPATGGLLYGTQGGADRKFTLSAAGAAVVESATAAEQRTALGLGALSTQNGIALGNTATSGASGGDILTSDGSVVQKITPGTGVSTALATAVNDTGGLLTYGIIGTSGATVPLLNSTNQFSNAQRFGSSNGDYLAIGSSSTKELRFASNAYGLGENSWIASLWDSGADLDPSGVYVFWQATLSVRGNIILYADIQWNDGTGMSKESLNKIMMKDWINPTNPCRFSIANTFSGSSNFESGVLDWSTTSNVLRIGSDVGSGGGTARDVQFIRGGVTKIALGADTTDHSQPVKLPSYIVSALPDAATCGAGAMAFATDAISTTAYSTVAGGGSSKVLVISDGTNWIIH